MKKELVVFLVAGALLVISSCKKSSDFSYPASDLVGTWKSYKIYVDTIGNGNINTAEVITDTQALTFYPNGNMSIIMHDITNGGDEVYQWSVIDSNACLRIFTGNYILGPGATISDTILSLTPTTLALKNTTGQYALISGTTWTYFTKE